MCKLRHQEKDAVDDQTLSSQNHRRHNGIQTACFMGRTRCSHFLAKTTCEELATDALAHTIPRSFCFCLWHALLDRDTLRLGERKSLRRANAAWTALFCRWRGHGHGPSRVWTALFCRWRGHGHEPSHGFQAVRTSVDARKRRCGVSRLDRYALTASRQCVRQQAWTSIAVDKRTNPGHRDSHGEKKVSRFGGRAGAARPAPPNKRCIYPVFMPSPCTLEYNILAA